MTSNPLLSIGDFALMTSLPAQTLRHYHSEGLLVPAEVDKSSGYRAYAFEQVNEAVLISALRGAGVSIHDIRGVLDSPDLLPGLLVEHRDALDRRRGQEDAAMAMAARLAAGWPVAEERSHGAVTAATRRVHGEAPGPDNVVVPAHVRAAAEVLRRDLADAGIPTTGPAWCRYAFDGPDDKAKVMTLPGPDWIVAFDLNDPDEPTARDHEDVELRTFSGRRERIVPMPATPTMGIFVAALQHLMRSSLDDQLVPDVGLPRYILGPDYVELAMTVEPASSLGPD